MTIKNLIIGLAICFVYGCASPYYLSKSKEIDINAYGSFIKITRPNEAPLEGELIAIDSTKMIILPNDAACVSYPISEIQKFNLLYAKPKSYDGPIFLMNLLSFSHGVWLLFTLPLNLISTISLANSGYKDFSYTKSTMTFDSLKMFARFPQGVPPSVNLANLYRINNDTPLPQK